MATCKDCIHAEVCPDKDNVVRPCYFFKDRSKFIEIPNGLNVDGIAKIYRGMSETFLSMANRLEERKNIND